jgi:heme/copper-type cytochrome/quinol oxidase subunit 2
MEFGFLLYFLIVFVFGGLLLLALTIYFVREFIVRKDRPAWSHRTRRSKLVLVVSTLLIVGLLFIPLRMMWVTRVSAIPGTYEAQGVWGTATLTMKQDGTFEETWHFLNEYNGKAEGDGSTKGQWHEDGRDWLTRNITLEHFASLAEYDRNHAEESRNVIVMGYGGVTAIDVDSGANITFFK